MGRKAITYKVVLEELNRERYWCYSNPVKNTEDRISLKEFRKVMMFNDVTTSERKVRELWKLMEDLDFFRKVNQSDFRIVDIKAVARALGFKTVEDESLTGCKTDEESTLVTSE